MIRRIFTAAISALAIFAGAFPVVAQQPLSWNYGFDANGNAWARYPGGVTVGSPTGGALGVGMINAKGVYVDGVPVGGGGVTPANPTATAATAAVNGVATTYMRSDAAPALGATTGTGSLVRATSPTLATPTLTSPTMTAPALGTPASGVLTNATGLPLTSGVTGILPIANGGTGSALGVSCAVINNGTFSASGGPGFSLTSPYKIWKFVVTSFIPSNASAALTVQFSFDGGATWKSGAADYAYNFVVMNSAVGINRSAAATSILISQNGMDTTAARPNTFTIDVIGPGAAGFGVFWRSEGIYMNGSNMEMTRTDGFTLPNYGTPTNFRILPSGGTLSGTYVGYGCNGI